MPAHDQNDGELGGTGPDAGRVEQRRRRRREWYIFGERFDKEYGLLLWWLVFAPISVAAVIGTVATVGRGEAFSFWAFCAPLWLAAGSMREGLHCRGRQQWLVVAGILAVGWLCFGVWLVRWASWQFDKAAILAVLVFVTETITIIRHRPRRKDSA